MGSNAALPAKATRPTTTTASRRRRAKRPSEHSTFPEEPVGEHRPVQGDAGRKEHGSALDEEEGVLNQQRKCTA